ncbi:MAG: methyltransferase domain-containing protein [Geobacteraceae bacterium]
MKFKVGTRNESTREAWLEQALQQVPSGSRILDAGAGQLKYKRFCAHLDYLSQDFAQYDGRGDGSGLQTGSWDQSKIDIVSDITDIPEPDASFDAIMCIEVLEHLPDPLLALQEFSRLLRPGGQLIVTAPFCSLTHFAPYHYCSGFNRYYYETHLPRFDFTLADFQENGNFFEFLAQEVRRIPFVGKRYTGSALRLWEKAAIYLMTALLERMSNKDSGSAELLNFGCHVRAVKDLNCHDTRETHRRTGQPDVSVCGCAKAGRGPRHGPENRHQPASARRPLRHAKGLCPGLLPHFRGTGVSQRRPTVRKAPATGKFSNLPAVKKVRAVPDIRGTALCPAAGSGLRPDDPESAGQRLPGWLLAVGEIFRRYQGTSQK